MNIQSKFLFGKECLVDQPEVDGEINKAFPFESTSDSILVVAPQIQKFAYAINNWMENNPKQPSSLILFSKESFSQQHPAIIELAKRPNVSFGICRNALEINEDTYTEAILRSPQKNWMRFNL